MVHSFYNDLNVKLSLSGDSVTLTKNPDSSFSYGLDYLFEINTLNSDGTLTLPISDFDKIVEDYVWKDSESEFVFREDEINKYIENYTEVK